MKKNLLSFRMVALAVGFLGLAGLCPGPATLLAQDQPAPVPTTRKVGELGDPRRLDFAGLNTFSPEAVRLALSKNLQFLLAAHPEAPLDNYPGALAHCIQTGYLLAGFPRVQVDVSPETGNGRMLVKITEGPRCLQAGIKVTGAVTIPVNQLIQRLTELPPPAPVNQQNAETWSASDNPGETNGVPCHCEPPTTPVWEPGKPADFDTSDHKDLLKGILEKMEELGFFFVHVEVEVVPDLTKGTADLVIHILDEGYAGSLEQINLTGLQHNHRDEVLAYLGLQPGVPMNRELLNHTKDLLWHAARFVAFEVTPQAGRDSRHLNLQINLTEFAAMPPLHQELSREARGLLRFRDWLANEPGPGQDLVIDFGPTPKPLAWTGLRSGRIIFSQSGLMLLAGNRSLADSSPGLYAAVFAPELIGLFDFARHLQFVCPLTNRAVQLKAYLNLLPDVSPTAKNPFNLTIGAGFSSVSDQDDLTPAGGWPPFKMDMLLAPLVFAGHAYTNQLETSCAFANGLMILTNADFQLTCEEQSGKLVTLQGPGELPFHVVTASNVFVQSLAQCLDFSTASRTKADDLTPINNLVSFLLQEAIQLAPPPAAVATNLVWEQRRQIQPVIERMLAGRPFAPLDAMVTREQDPAGSEAFAIPEQPDPAGKSEAETWQVFAGTAMQQADTLFPRDSWPWLASRETILTLAQQGQYTAPALESLKQEDKTGPLGYTLISWLLGQIHSPAAAEFARQGLARLGPADFDLDCRLLLDPNFPLGQCFANLAQGLAGLNERDMQQLSSPLSPANAALLKAARQAMGTDSNQAPVIVLSPLLREIWETRLKTAVANTLSPIAHEPAPQKRTRP